MKNRKFDNLIAVAALLTLLLPSSLFAQGKTQAETKRAVVTKVVQGRTISAETPAMLDVTEANFIKYKDDTLAILNAQKATLIRMNLPVDERVNTAIRDVTAMQFTDVKPEQKGFVDMTALRAAVVGQQAAIAEAYAAAATRAQFSPSDPFPNAEYASFCPLNPQSPEVAYTSGFVLLAAKVVRDVAQDICNQVFLVLGVGGNTTLACTITDIIYSVAAVIDYPIQACHDDTYGAQATGTFTRLEYIHNQLDYSIANDNTNKAMLSTQLTNAENRIVTNDNSNKAALSGQIGSFQTLSLRVAIEANLAEDPATIAAVGLYETPASKGGYLELARQILIDVYNAHVAAAGVGVTVYNPSSELSLGANFTAQGKYREAYYYYRRAYRSVVKYP